MPHSEVAHLEFNQEQSQAIAVASQAIAVSGGPETAGAALQARVFAEQTRKNLGQPSARDAAAL